MLEKKYVASELIKKAPRLPDLYVRLRVRLDKLKNRPEPKGDDDNFNLSPSPLSPPRPPSLRP